MTSKPNDPKQLHPTTRAVLARALDELQESEGNYYLRVLGDPVLTVETRWLQAITDLQPGLLDGMQKVITKLAGVGIAAPQVGSHLRCCLARLTTHDRMLQLFLNPTIVEHAPELVAFPGEGCLSAPADEHGKEFFRMTTQRWPWVVVEFSEFPPTGGEVRHRLRLEGMDAQIMQHECDHLDGRCIWSSLTGARKKQATKGVARYLKFRGRTV